MVIDLQSLRKALCRLLVACQTTEDHAALSVEIRQLWETCKCLLGKRQHLFVRRVKRTHGLDHLVIDLATIADERSAAAQCLLG